MEKINSIGTDLFNKIRGRFSEVVLGDSEGNVVSDPAEARFFEFEYTSNGLGIGKVSVNVNNDELTVIYSKDLLTDNKDFFKDEWYEFLKEMRKFAKRRLLQFDVRDIEKTNLTKRDYQFLANTRSGEDNMNESKMYGTARTSYQKVDNARIVIKHTAPINTESSASRTQHISAIYIESAEGERFKYPYKHLSGARAMARHVSEGGKLYDDFGSHIVGLSEEMHKLRKFKAYMGKSNVMAESLVEYVDVVNNRITEVKKTIDRLQKSTYYREAFDGFEKPILEDVPADVADSWIDQLTIKQFNEELKDVFPYIYRLVGEAKQAEVVALEDIVDEANPCWKGYKQIGMKEKRGKKVPNCVPEEIELEQAFEAIMGQFADDEASKKKVKEAYSSEQSEWPFVKFREHEVNTPTGKKKLLQAVVSVSAPTPGHFDSNSPDVLRYTIGPPKADSKYRIFDPLERMMRSLKVKNNTTGITVVNNKFLKSDSTYEKYPFLYDWMNTKTRAELKTVDYDSESPEAAKKRKKIIFVDVKFSNGEIVRMDSEILMIDEYLIDPNETDNPFVQGTPVTVMDNKSTQSTRAGQKGVVELSHEYDLTQPVVYASVRFADSKVEYFKINQLQILGNINYSQDSVLKPGTQVRVTNKTSPRKGQEGTVEHSWIEDPNKLFANQKFKDIKAKKEEPNEKVMIQNGKIFSKLKKEYYDQFYKKYYKPRLFAFDIPAKELEAFKALVYSPEFAKLGNPELYFLNDQETGSRIPDAVKARLDPRIQQMIDKAQQGDADKEPQAVDDPNVGKQEHDPQPTVNNGPFSNRSFKNLINKLTRIGLISQFTIELKDFQKMEKIDKEKIKTYMDEISREQDITTVKDIAAEIIMLQNIFDSSGPQREDDIIKMLRTKTLIDVKSFMQTWYLNGLSSAARLGKPIVAVPAIPPKEKEPEKQKTRKIPDGQLAADEGFKKEDLDMLSSMKNPDAAKAHVHRMFDNSKMLPDVKRMYKNRLDRLTSVPAVQALVWNMIQRWAGDPVLQQTEFGFGDKSMTTQRDNPYAKDPFARESIEEAKDYNFNADDLLQLSQIHDLDAAKQFALKLITAKSTRPMTKEKVAYFTNALSSKKTVDAVVKMMYDLLLSGRAENLGVIGDRYSTGRSRYRQNYEGDNMESNLDEMGKFGKAMALALGLGAAAWALDSVSAKHTPLGQALQAAAEQGDERAAEYLRQLDGLIQANNNGEIQYISRQYLPRDESKKENNKAKKIPYTEFIMSHFDKKTGKFPKGETAVLTMVEKEYGEKYIEPAREFMEKLKSKVEQYNMRSNSTQIADSSGLDRIKSLAGL